MWRNRRLKVITILLASLILLAGVVGGVAYAQTEDTPADNNPGNTLFAKVAAILGIDQQQLEDAFVQAQKEIRDEELTNRLDSLVEQGKITQEQADQYEQWWQSRPEVLPELGFGDGPGIPGGPHGMRCPGGNPPSLPPPNETSETN